MTIKRLSAIAPDDCPAVSFFTKSVFPRSRMTIRFLAGDRRVLNALTSRAMQSAGCFATRFIGCLVISAGPRPTVSTIPALVSIAILISYCDRSNRAPVYSASTRQHRRARTSTRDMFGLCTLCTFQIVKEAPCK